jgi:hypothetical protein
VRIVLSLGVALAIGCTGSRPPATAPAVPGGDPPAHATAEPSPPSPQANPERGPRPRPIPPPPGGRRDALPADARPRSDVIVFGREDTVDSLPGWQRAGERRFDRKSDYWSPCIRDFVQTQPEPARAALGEALSLYSTSCTGAPVRRIEFRTPPAGRVTPAASHLGLIGALDPTTCDLALTAAYHGEPIQAERILLIADGVRWSSPRIAFDREDGWETATLPLTRSLARVVQQAITARDTVLRFEGARDYQDVVVTEEMKQDLRMLLDALDAINRL